MTDNTLYYLFSTIPQILVAVVALVGVFVFYRDSQLKEFLVGEGKAALTRIQRKEKGYVLNDFYINRLSDSIDRKNVHEIGKVLEILKNKEIEEGFTKEERPTGLQYVYEDRFMDTRNRLNKLKKQTKFFIIFSIIEISVSLVMISLVDQIKNKDGWMMFSYVFVLLFLFILTLIYSVVLTMNGLKEDSSYENS